MIEVSIPRTQHDALTRYVFCRPRAAAIILRHVLPPGLLAALDLETLALLSSAHTRPSLGNRDADLIFSVDLRDCLEPLSIRIAIEHHSNPDALQTWRAMVYAGEQWGRYVSTQSPRPRTLPFILPIVLVQSPARHAPTRLSEIIALPANLRDTFGAPFEVKLYVDDLSGTVLNDPDADAGHLALVEITRTLLYAYKNHDSLTQQRLRALGPLLDTVLVHFGSAEVKELWTYVIEVFGARSPLGDILLESSRKAAREMYMTIADKLRSDGRAEGRAEGRAAAKAEALLGVLEHRAVPITGSFRERVLSTPDEALLQRWFDRAFEARSLDEVLAT